MSSVIWGLWASYQWPQTFALDLAILNVYPLAIHFNSSITHSHFNCLKFSHSFHIPPNNCRSTAKDNTVLKVMTPNQGSRCATLFQQQTLKSEGRVLWFMAKSFWVRPQDVTVQVLFIKTVGHWLHIIRSQIHSQEELCASTSVTWPADQHRMPDLIAGV